MPQHQDMRHTMGSLTLGAAMSRLTPTHPMSDFLYQQALAIIAARTATLDQAEALIRAITINDDESLWAPDVDKMADEFYLASQAAKREAEPDEEPYMSATIGAEDQPRGAL